MASEVAAEPTMRAMYRLGLHWYWPHTYWKDVPFSRSLAVSRAILQFSLVLIVLLPSVMAFYRPRWWVFALAPVIGVGVFAVGIACWSVAFDMKGLVAVSLSWIFSAPPLMLVFWLRGRRESVLAGRVDEE